MEWLAFPSALFIRWLFRRDVMQGINGKWSPLLVIALAEKPMGRSGELGLVKN